MRFKRRILTLALIPVLGVPLSACDWPGDTCDAITLTVTGVDAGGRGGGGGGSGGGKSGKSGGKSKTTTGGGTSGGGGVRHDDDDCDD